MNDKEQPVVIVRFYKDRFVLYACQYLPTKILNKIEHRISSEINQTQKIISEIVDIEADCNNDY
ncbi:MAG: hypothetical protein ISR95_06870 [Candidatus Marinimicrobia bacterium]|nr:hypothetical protein [Candidatus Neomarinimicrobiota bacterium]